MGLVSAFETSDQPETTACSCVCVEMDELLCVCLQNLCDE